jgi:subtilisin family serine protease
MNNRTGQQENGNRITKSRTIALGLATALAAGMLWLLMALTIADGREERPVQSSLPPLMAAVSEGSQVALIADWRGTGLSGRGVKVGVLDLGFLGYANRIAEGELPTDVITQSFVSDGSEMAFWGRPVTPHGTACAEVIHDVAPDARLYLANFSDEDEWTAAVNWLLAQDVDVISFSGGWPLGGPGDGTGYLADKVTEVREAGVLWVNAAGNVAQQHWMGQWRDDAPDGPDGWHDFDLTDGTNAITVTDELQIVLGLRWNDPWGASANDYDLFLFREENDSLTEVARSDAVQDGDDAPLEVIVYAVPSPGVYHVVISKQPEAAPRTLELFSYYQAFQHQTAASSLVVPADSPGSLTVGATYWQADALESFSSQGPTRDGRAKPDLSAPDGISVSTEWYADGFYGTSASAPHVAGAAALVLEAHPTFTPAQVQGWLEDRALDLGEAGRDNVYGAGRLNLGTPPHDDWAREKLRP